MKVLGIYGSPRKGGNTDQLLDKCLEGVRTAGASTEAVYARDIRASGCLECGGCDKTGECVVKDGMQEIYPLMENADAVILASPVFFYGLTAQVKVIVDRSQAMWARRLLRGTEKDALAKSGYLISAGATRGKNLFLGIELEARYFFDALSARYAGSLLYRGLEGKRDVSARPDALEEAFKLGEKIVKGWP